MPRTHNDDTGSLYTGALKVELGNLIRIEGEGRDRRVTNVMGSTQKGWRACFKGQGAVPVGTVSWEVLSATRPADRSHGDTLLDDVLTDLGAQHSLRPDGLQDRPKTAMGDNRPSEKQNPQAHNVGNLGDIHKHAALVRLANLVRDRNPGPINYLDTHAFVPQAPIYDPVGWRREIDRLMAEHPAHRAYRDIEAPKVDEGQYLCSTGLAIHVLERPRLFLAEQDRDTFQELSTQLRRMSLEPNRLLTAMEGFVCEGLSDSAGPLLALFDPFKLAEEELRRTWATACEAVTALTQPGRDGVVLVFQWDRQPPIVLPPPTGYFGPVATISKSPFHLCVFVTEGVCLEVGATLANLGWTINPADHRQLPPSQDSRVPLPRRSTPPTDARS
ncbi:MAG: hypothetical protein WCK05_15790, partial [Planctomycetota bacterium]